MDPLGLWGRLDYQSEKRNWEAESTWFRLAADESVIHRRVNRESPAGSALLFPELSGEDEEIGERDDSIPVEIAT